MTIKQLRELAGMTQLQFSVYFKIPLQTVKGWESKGGKSGRTCNEYILELIAYKLLKEGFITEESFKMQ